MSTFKVLIIGGGIAGPSLAFWLNRLSGHQGVTYAVTIIERSADLRAQGQQIDLRGQGLTVMRLMGLEKRVREKVVAEEGVQFVDKTGRRMAVLEANKTGKGAQSVTSEFEIMRGDLVRILYDAVKEKTKYVFGLSVTQMEEVDDQVKVTFSDGSQEEYDLVVGADGQNSRTRRRMPEADTTDPFTSLGVYMAYFTVPRTAADSDYACIHHMVGGRVVFTRADNPKTIQVAFAIIDSSPYAAQIRAAIKSPFAEQKEVWAEVFRDSAGWQGERFVDALLHNPLCEESFYGYELGQVKTQTWTKGRVVLLGDAGYCPSPMTGFGTSLAMVGAYVLAGELAQHMHDGRVVDVPAALDGYAHTLRPLVKQVQKLPPGVPRVFYPQTEWGIWFLQTVIWTVTVLRIDKLVQMLSSDDRGTWKLPDYQVLKETA